MFYTTAKMRIIVGIFHTFYRHTTINSAKNSMKQELSLSQEVSYVESLVAPYGYQLDTSGERIFFWRAIEQNDLRSPYAFSLVLITFWDHTITIEGLNEPRLKRAIRAGLIEVNTEEEVDALKELVFEADYDNLKKLQVVLPFFEQQLATIERDAIHTPEYKRALANIQLLVEAAAQIE